MREYLQKDFFKFHNVIVWRETAHRLYFSQIVDLIYPANKLFYFIISYSTIFFINLVSQATYKKFIKLTCQKPKMVPGKKETTKSDLVVHGY